MARVFERNSVGGCPETWRGLNGRMRASELPMPDSLKPYIAQHSDVDVEVFLQGRVKLNETGQPLVGADGRIMPGCECEGGPEVWTMRITSELDSRG